MPITNSLVWREWLRNSEYNDMAVEREVIQLGPTPLFLSVHFGPMPSGKAGIHQVPLKLLVNTRVNCVANV